MQDTFGIKIDYDRDSLFDELGLKRLKESYMTEEETSPQQRFAYVSKTFSSDLKHAQRLYDYSSKHWLSYSTPILSFGRSKKGLPISCFLVYLPDTSSGLVNTFSEVSRLSMAGGGIGLGLGIRSSDDKSTGIMAHLKTYDAACLAYRQGRTRRGSYAIYLDISHPDIIQFLEMRKSTGDYNLRCLNLHHGINITNKFMNIIEKCMVNNEENDDWELVDPNTKEVKEIISAKYLWQRILELRMQTGEPFLHFIDTSNKYLSQFQKDLGLNIKQTNLCTEIILPTDENRTAICCLSSVNLEYYDVWKNNKLFLQDIAEMLDNVLQYFIDNAPKYLKRAIYSASRERAIGIGALGFHSYLQSKHVSFESVVAKSYNNSIFKNIREKLDKANIKIGKERGECPDMKKTGKRFSHIMAIAPNATSSIIMGNTSPSVEPYRANVYRQDTLSGSFMNKNMQLDKYIKENFPDNYDKMWASILSNDGSVYKIKEFDDHTKEVYKTAIEIDQRWVIEHASDRQKYIDQAQSINLFFKPDVNITYLHAAHYLAWKTGLKTLYYCRSEKIRKLDKLANKIERKIIKELDMKELVEGETCLACE